MSDQIGELTQQNAVKSSDATAPVKHSLRVLESISPGRSTREDDLANGPLLLALGDGHEDPIVSHQDTDLTSQYSRYRLPEESILPYIPLRRQETLPTRARTSSTMSQSGPSLSVPPESIPCSDRSCQAFPVTSEVIPDCNQLLAGELPESSVVRDRDAFSFSQSYEFSWQDSGLYFGTEPFRVARTPDDWLSKVDPGSERVLSEPHEPATCLVDQDVQNGILASLGMAGIGSSIENLSPTILLGDLELASMASSASSSTASSLGTIDFDAIEEPSDPQLVIAMEKYAEWAVELLIDDFYRSCASQASQGRSHRVSKKVIGSDLDNDDGKRKAANGKSRVESKFRKRKALGGDDESEDEDSRDKKRAPSTVGKDRSRLRWACPYVKWNPDKYKCKIGPTQLRGINAHIKNIHWKKYCDKCWRCYSTSKEEMAHEICEIRSGSSPPPGLMTKEMKSEIFESKPASSGLSHEKQWFRLYGILFPGEPQGFSPYVNERNSDFMDRAEVRFRSKESRKILEEVILESEVCGVERKQIIDMIWAKYLPRMFREDALNNKNPSTSASHKIQIIENAPYWQVDAPGTDTEITACDSMYHVSPPCPEETCISHQVLGLEFLDLMTFSPQPVEGETIGGNQTPNAWVSPTEFENVLSSIEPRDSECCYETMFDKPLDSNFEDPLYSKLDVDGDYQEYISSALNWVGDELLEQV